MVLVHHPRAAGSLPAQLTTPKTLPMTGGEPANHPSWGPVLLQGGEPRVCGTLVSHFPPKKGLCVPGARAPCPATAATSAAPGPTA